MDFDKKDVLIGILCLVVAAMWWDGRSSSDFKGSDYEQLATNVVRAQTDVVEKIVMPKVSKEIDDRIKKSNVKMVGEIRSVVRGELQGRHGNADKTTKKYKAVKKDIAWTYDGDKKFPIGSAIYKPETDKWYAVAYGLNFDTTVVQQLKWDGTYETYVETWATHKNLKEENGGGGRYPLEINKAQFQIKEPNEMTFSLWNPTLFAGLSVTPSMNTTLSDVGVIASFNFINYGYSKQLPVFSFMSPSVIISQNKIDPALSIATVNVGHYAPVIKDLHLGVGIDWNKNAFLSLTSVF